MNISFHGEDFHCKDFAVLINMIIQVLLLCIAVMTIKYKYLIVITAIHKYFKQKLVYFKNLMDQVKLRGLQILYPIEINYYNDKNSILLVY